MKCLPILLAILLALSLVFITNGYQQKQRSNNALREQLLDYLLEAKRQELLYHQRRELENQIHRHREYIFNNDDANSNDDYERTDVRRKAVGLGDNPFK